MATVRDLERLLTDSGMSSSRLDTINRQLRETGDLPTAGRGLHAAKISDGEAAAVLIAYAGSGKAIRAGQRLQKLRDIRSVANDRLLFAVVRNLLEDPSEVKSLRISRVRRRATLLLTDGTVDAFMPSNAKSTAGRFENEAVLDGGLLAAVSALLRGNDHSIPPADEAEEGE